MDGEPSFAAAKPFRLHGLDVKFVSAWAPEGGRFTRAPGTAPGTFVSVAFEATREAVEQRLGPESVQDGPHHRFITDEIVAYGYKKQTGLTEAICELAY